MLLIYPWANNVDFSIKMVISAIIELKIVKFFIVLAAILKKTQIFRFLRLDRACVFGQMFPYGPNVHYRQMKHLHHDPK